MFKYKNIICFIKYYVFKLKRAHPHHRAITAKLQNKFIFSKIAMQPLLYIIKIKAVKRIHS